MTKYYECQSRRLCGKIGKYFQDCVGRRKHTKAEHKDCEDKNGELIPCTKPGFCHEVNREVKCVEWKKRDHHGFWY